MKNFKTHLFALLLIAGYNRLAVSMYTCTQKYRVLKSYNSLKDDERWEKENLKKLHNALMKMKNEPLTINEYNELIEIYGKDLSTMLDQNVTTTELFNIFNTPKLVTLNPVLQTNYYYTVGIFHTAFVSGKPVSQLKKEIYEEKTEKFNEGLKSGLYKNPNPKTIQLIPNPKTIQLIPKP